jgi:hypothetical protein
VRRQGRVTIEVLRPLVVPQRGHSLLAARAPIEGETRTADDKKRPLKKSVGAGGKNVTS